MATVELTDVNPQSFTDMIAYMNVVNPNFWLYIFGAIYIIITSTLYGRQVLRKGEGDILLSMSVSAIFIMVLSTVGTIFGLILKNTFLEILAFGIIILGLWWFNK